jgi:hypothetical protein
MGNITNLSVIYLNNNQLTTINISQQTSLNYRTFHPAPPSILMLQNNPNLGNIYMNQQQINRTSSLIDWNLGIGSSILYTP